MNGYIRAGKRIAQFLKGGLQDVFNVDHAADLCRDLPDGAFLVRAFLSILQQARAFDCESSTFRSCLGESDLIIVPSTAGNGSAKLECTDLISAQDQRNGKAVRMCDLAVAVQSLCAYAIEMIALNRLA